MAEFCIVDITRMDETRVVRLLKEGAVYDETIAGTELSSEFRISSRYPRRELAEEAIQPLRNKYPGIRLAVVVFSWGVPILRDIREEE